ncbi:MAG: TetR/AcrR family transcriptional regulator [Terracidiphilus sp.]|jgi:TetR/AcrR family transcriptional regulator
MAASNSNRTQTERADQTRGRILDAAVRQFSESGLAGARTEQIAEEAGVNKALLYYYFKSKEDLYAAALESVFEGVQTASIAVLQTEASAGERFVQIILDNFDRSYSHPSVRTLMQQEMVRLHQGEENRMAQMAERFFRPMWARVQEVLEEGIRSGELIPVDPQQIRYGALGANVFYFLTAPLVRLAFGFDPLERGELERRRSAVIEYLGQAIFIDREQGARVAARVLAATPMPEPTDLSRNANCKGCNIEAVPTSANKARQK